MVVNVSFVVQFRRLKPVIRHALTSVIVIFVPYVFVHTRASLMLQGMIFISSMIQFLNG